MNGNLKLNNRRKLFRERENRQMKIIGKQLIAMFVMLLMWNLNCTTDDRSEDDWPRSVGQLNRRIDLVSFISILNRFSNCTSTNTTAVAPGCIRSGKLTNENKSKRKRKEGESMLTKKKCH